MADDNAWNKEGAQQEARATAAAEVETDGYKCLPRHRTHCAAFFLELNGIP